jgi:hypothetical protein
MWGERRQLRFDVILKRHGEWCLKELPPKVVVLLALSN